MNPEKISLTDVCIDCISLEATTAHQERLQATCSEILDTIAGWEMILDEDPETFPDSER